MGKVLAVLVQGPLRIRNTYTKDGEVVCVCNPGDGWGEEWAETCGSSGEGSLPQSCVRKQGEQR